VKGLRSCDIREAAIRISAGLGRFQTGSFLYHARIVDIQPASRPAANDQSRSFISATMDIRF